MAGYWPSSFFCAFMDRDEVEVHKLAKKERGQYEVVTIWLAPRAGKMNQIVRCDWLPERARWSHIARTGLHAVSRKKYFTESHIINPLLTKFVRSRWLDMASLFFFFFFLRIYGP